MKTTINWKVAGAAGTGVKTTGLMWARALTRAGYSTFSYTEYPSLIRGGHNTFQVLAGVEAVTSQHWPVDVLVALNQTAVDNHRAELIKGSMIIYDSDTVKSCVNSEDCQCVPINLNQIAQEAANNTLMANVVALGVCLALFSLKTDELKQILAETFGAKGKAIVQANQACAQAGWDYTHKHLKDKIVDLQPAKDKSPKMVITGNEATALGAIGAGLKFYSAYPMTPATSILHYLAKEAETYSLVVKQPEDEIAAINQTIGAAFAGVRAMTATSGGGFCLMTEGLGFSGVSETPIVVVVSQRPGPASGVPTWHGQGDLQFVVNASQDEFPRLVLAPGDAQECFDLIQTAFEISEQYQLPAIFLLDKHISESFYSPQVFPAEHTNQRYSFTPKEIGDNYLRYQVTANGISSRPILGQKNGHHLCNSYEHTQYGLATEVGEEISAMRDKRQLKFAQLAQAIPEPKVYGPDQASVSLISWGSTKGAVLEALKDLPAVNYLHLNWLWPLPVKAIESFIKSAKVVVDVENNSQGQLAQLIRQQTGLKIDQQLLKYDGRPFYPEEIRNYVNQLKAVK